jgi:hypothetical protein
VGCFDARVDGGFPVPGPLPSPVCEGEACQGAPAVPPVFGTPGSATFDGAGNLTPAAAAPVKAKPLTRAQKLAKALEACKKDKAKKKRSSCEKQARKRYGAKKATAKKSKK